MRFFRPRLAATAATVALAALLHGGAAWAGVEVNQATEAQLDGVKGLGPATSGRILLERAQRPFADWPDLIARVKGIGPLAAQRLSTEGVTVNGAAYPRPARHTDPAQQSHRPDSPP